MKLESLVIACQQSRQSSEMFILLAAFILAVNSMETNWKKNPKLLQKIRASLGFSQIKFARFLGTKQSTLSALERGAIKTVSEEAAECFAKKLKDVKIAFMTENEMQQKLLQISQRGKFKGEYARRMALKVHSKNAVESARSQPLTKQEERINTLLKESGLHYEIHPAIDAGGISFVADFKVEKNRWMILVEAKEFRTKYRLKAPICELAYKATRIKRFNKNVMMVAVVSGRLMQSEKKILSDEFDAVFEDEGKILEFVNRLP